MAPQGAPASPRKSASPRGLAPSRGSTSGLFFFAVTLVLIGVFVFVAVVGEDDASAAATACRRVAAPARPLEREPSTGVVDGIGDRVTTHFPPLLTSRWRTVPWPPRMLGCPGRPRVAVVATVLPSVYLIVWFTLLFV